MTPCTKPADDWSREKAAHMHRQGYPAGIIIAKLQACGIGLYAAQAIVGNLNAGGAK